MPRFTPIFAVLCTATTLLFAVGAVALAAAVRGDASSLSASVITPRLPGHAGSALSELRAEGRRIAAARYRATAVRKRRAAAAQHARVAAALRPTLQKIAMCESHGNPRAIGGGGTYRGKYQFNYGTWASVGGSGDPAAAPEAEQDYRAALLYQRSGAGQWPVCGH